MNIYKHSYYDKYDGYIPNKQEFLHDRYYASKELERFSNTSTYGYVVNAAGYTKRGFVFGVQKKVWKASRLGGTKLDYNNRYFGTSDQT